MKSKNPKIQTILTKGLALILLFILMFSSLSSFQVVFAEETGTEGESESGTSDPVDETVDDDYIYSEETDNVVNELEKDIAALQQQLEDLKGNQDFKYESFKEKVEKKSVIEVSSEIELRALSIYVAEGHNCANKTFKLKNNIVLTDTEEWSPIGNKSNPFKGTLDGAGYTISGMLITVKQSYAGLIGYLGNGGVVKNLTMSESKVNMTPEIDNKINNDLILSSNNNPITYYAYLGGIVGFANQGTISNCINKSNISGGHSVGGIVGDTYESVVQDCRNIGTVKGLVSVGGISGYAYGYKVGATIDRCYNTGTIQSSIGAVGGIVGSIYSKNDNNYNTKVIVKNSVNNGEIICGLALVDLYVYAKKYETTPHNIGGIVGNAGAQDEKQNESDYEVEIENCTNKAAVSGYLDVGGIIGQLGSRIASEKVGTVLVKRCYNENAKIESVYYNQKDQVYRDGHIAGNISNTLTKKDSLGRIMHCSYKGYHGETDTKTTSDKLGGYGRKPADDKIKTTFVEVANDYTYPYEGARYTVGYWDAQGPEMVVNNNATDVTTDDFKEVVLLLNGTEVTSEILAKKDDIATIKIKFNEKINVGRIKPSLNVFNGLATYRGVDQEFLIFEYKVLGTETNPISNSIVLNGTLYDVFGIEKKYTNSSIHIASTKDIKVIRSNASSIVLDSEYVHYTISGAVNDGKGNLYFNEGSTITVIANFTNGVTSGLSDNSLPKLKIKIGSDVLTFENGAYNSSQKTMTYTIDTSEIGETNKKAITDVYLEKNGLTINNNDVNLNSSNSKVTFSNIFVDTMAPTLLEPVVSVNNKKENHKYTVGEEILIKATTSERIDVKNSITPEINVSFSESGLGKYNYQPETSKGNAKFIEVVENKDSNGNITSYTYKYRYVIQPGDEGSLNLQYLAGEIKDTAGNITTISNGTKDFKLIADTIAPTVVITANKTNPTNANTIEYSFTWNEEVEEFTVEDITVNGGTKGDLIPGSEAGTFIMNVTPNVESGNVGEVQVIVEQNTCIDVVGQGNVRSENVLTVDKDGPTLESYNVFINEEKTEITVEAIFDESIRSVVSGNNLLIKIGGKNIAGSLITPEVSGDKVIYKYNVVGADGGNVDIALIGKVKDIAGNESEQLDVKIDNNIVLEKHVIESSNGVEYSFSKNDVAITDFSVPTYFKVGDKIKVTVDGITSYEYTVVEGNNGHMKKMTVIPAQEETEGSVSFSSDSGTVDISAANIYFDTTAPTVELSATIEESVANNIYAKGKEIIIIAKTNEEITNKDQIPEINVSFSESGLGKYNYQTETGKGNAKYLETIVNEDKSISWKYKYVVTEGDEGEILLEYANSNNKVIDLAGNGTSLIGYPEKSNTSISVSDLTDKDITGKETKVSYKFYKNDAEIKDFSNNTYYKKGDTIKVVVKFTNELYSAHGSTTTYVEDSTAPQLKIEGKVFTANVDNNKQITYTYKVNNDSNEKLEKLELKFNTTLYAKKSDNLHEAISGTNELNISNANLYIYNNGTLFNKNNIKVDTITPTVEISAKKVEGTAKTDISNNVTNANTLEYTFTWSEAVVGFTAEDITVNGGTKGEFNKLTDRAYTLKITPAESTEKVQVIVEKNVCQDAVGHENVRSESVIRIDKIAPILISLEAYGTSNINVENIDSVKEDYKAGDIVTIVATFSENIEGSTAPALALQFNGVNAKGQVSQGIISENKITYTYTIDDDTGTLSVKGFSGTVIDKAGNQTTVTKRTLDGDTIIADTTEPKLLGITAIAPDFKYDELLKDGETKRYGTNNTIIIIAEYSENVYNLNLNSNKINNISDSNDPTLTIKFGNTERTASFSRFEGNKIYYTYNIANGDNGDLSIKSLAGTVSDIAGNTYSTTASARLPELDKYEAEIKAENEVTNITADTTQPNITFDVTAVNYDEKGNVITGNGDYYRKGAVITIKATTDEYVYKNINKTLEEFTKNDAPELNISFSTTGTGFGTCTDVKYENNETVFTYTYTVQPIKDTDELPYEDWDNGKLELNIDASSMYDIALNGNVEKEDINDDVYADTVNPVTNWTAWTPNEGYGIVYDSENKVWKVTFNEILYVYDNANYKVVKELSNSDKGKAPILLVTNGTGEIRTEVDSISKTNNKTVITYKLPDGVNYTENMGTRGIDLESVSDKAGNLFNYKDQIAPRLEKIEVINPETGTYKAGEVITIVATFNEKLDVNSVAPTLALQFSDSGDAKGTVNRGVIEENKITYTYTIKEGDNGRLSAKSFTGKGLKDLSDNVWVAPETVSLSGNAITADTEPPKLVITSDVEKTNNYVVTYTFTWDEIVTDFTKEDIEIINGSKADFKQEDSEGKVYTLTVDSLEEGRQIVKVDVGVCEDIAGNLNSERATYNKVVIDYTKPIIRAKVNGGTYVIDTDSAKSILKEIIVVNEELSKFEYAWSSETKIDNVNNWEEVDVSGIIANSDINLESEKTSTGTYYLYIRAIDLAGNTLATRTNGFVVLNSKISFSGIPTSVTNQDIVVTVTYGEGLTENRKAGISGKTQSADASKIIITENGTVYAESIDKAGNKVYKTFDIKNIDKVAPEATIGYTTNEDGSVTATISFNEKATITNNSGKTTYEFTENGEFTFEFKDEAGNIGTAVAKVTTIVPRDEIAPNIIFNYTLSNVTLGNPIGATIVTDEDAKISYKWDDGEWITSEEYITSINVTYEPKVDKIYTLYAKATDEAGNTSDIQKLEFTVVEEIKIPEIIFEDLSTIQVDGVKYVKVTDNMTKDDVTSKMNKEALCGQTPEYTKLAEGNDLRTGSEITLNGETKYIVVVNGDVNSDGKIDFVKDIIRANNYRLGIIKLNVPQMLAADVNGNGKIEFIQDIISINNYRLGLIKSL